MNPTTRFLPLLGPGPYCLRAFKCKGKGARTAVCSTPESAASVAAQWEDAGLFTGVFINVNPVSSDFQQEKWDLAEKGGKAPRTPDTTHRQAFFVDIDTERPDGEPASDAELQAAIKIADEVERHLRSFGFPEMVRVCSGNGMHLWGGVDLPATKETDALLKSALKAIADHIKATGLKGAKVDTGVWDAARVARMPGSRNRKGDPSESRPHRPCEVIRWPEGDSLPMISRDAIPSGVGTRPLSGSRSSLQMSSAPAGANRRVRR